MATLKVVLDTNVVLSGLVYPGSIPGRIVNAWHSGSLRVYSSMYLFDELRRVLPRLSHRHGMSEREMDDLVDILLFRVDLLVPLELPEGVVRDHADTSVLGTFLAAHAAEQANYLISGDKDLLALSERFPVLSPAQFWARHGL